MAVNGRSPENTQIAPNACAPQKWPPERSIEKFENLVAGDVKPGIANPKLSELIVRPE